MDKTRILGTLLFAAGMLGLAMAAQNERAIPSERPGYARLAPQAIKSLVLQVARAGKSLVTVGEYGGVLLSDDQGKSWRQAQSVPTTTTLTSVSFVDEKQGWAVGHGGVIIATKDGGENWRLLAGKPDGPEILFSVFFTDANHGMAVGPYGYAIETTDGGNTWIKRELAQGEDGERHLNQIFAGPSGTLLIAAEAGTVFRSEDGGRTWAAIKVPYKGSLWGGLALSDGTLLLYGMRGHVLRSADKGASWTDAVAGDQSLSGAAQFSDGTLVLVGLGGAVLRSRDGGKTFEATINLERTSYTAVAEGAGGTPILFGLTGVQRQVVGPPASIHLTLGK
jgi:photosystem II stability/assembly factor-like uncharacterized protein